MAASSNNYNNDENDLPDLYSPPLVDVPSDAPTPPPVMRYFDDANLNLKDALLSGIFAYGWERPSPIQRDAIPAINTKRDLIMQAQSGLGKTGAYSIGLLQQINDNTPEVQGLIILPTRELADQVYNVIAAIGDRMDINFIKCIGGIQFRDRLRFPKRATVFVATPGKLCGVLEDHLFRSQTFNLNCCIIDEFDKILAEDFAPAIKQIIKQQVGQQTQVILSSATVNNEALKIADHFMRQPIVIRVSEEDLSLDGIKQFYIKCCKEEWKFDVIIDLYNHFKLSLTVIFVNSKAKCDELEERFRNENYTIDSIHAGMEQSDRDYIMDKFRRGDIRILLSTDLLARGIDVSAVSMVVNYDLPKQREQYLHRIGRAGRFGKKGIAINLIGSNYEWKLLETIEDYYRVTIQEFPANFSDLL